MARILYQEVEVGVTGPLSISVKNSELCSSKAEAARLFAHRVNRAAKSDVGDDLVADYRGEEELEWAHSYTKNNGTRVVCYYRLENLDWTNR